MKVETANGTDLFLRYLFLRAKMFGAQLVRPSTDKELKPEHRSCSTNRTILLETASPHNTHTHTYIHTYSKNVKEKTQQVQVANKNPPYFD